MAQYVAICRALSAGLLSILGKGTKGHYSLPSITITAANICGDHWFQVQKKKKESNVCYSVILIEQDSNTFNLLEVYKRTRADNPKVILGIYEQHQYCWQQLSQIKHCQVPYLTRVFFFWTSSQGFLRDKAVQQTRLGALGNWVRIHETVDISSHYGMLNYQYFLCRHSIDGVLI